MQQQHALMMHGARNAVMVTLVLVLLLLFDLSPCVSGQVPYTGHLSDTRIQELHNLARRVDHSINSDKYACDSYYDYVCSRNQPVFSILGHLPHVEELMELLTKLQNDPYEFDAKKKLMDFFTSCNKLKSLEDCYRQSFEYFKPIFGYIIVKNYISASSHEYRTFMELLKRFLEKSDRTTNFYRYPTTHYQISLLREKFNDPSIYFTTYDLDREYRNLTIYRDTYDHNVRILQEYRKLNSTYVVNVHRTMLDWSLYVYQSRNKPMSYYYSTLNVHLWMTLYNNTERMREPKKLHQYAECLKLSAFVTTLEEARILAIVYLKSFRNAWQEYQDWITATRVNQGINDHENAILKKYYLSNQRLFFTFYAQNFCEFGKELAESVFYIGLHQTPDFFTTYSCGYQTELARDCV